MTKLCKEAKIVNAANTSDFGVEESTFQNMVDVPETVSSERSSADKNVASASDEYATSARPRIFAKKTTDNFTETSESGLFEELDNIDFRLRVSSTGHHKDYICCHCSRYVKSLIQAKLHFVENHQNSDAEKKTIMKLKMTALDHFEKIKEVVEKGGNYILAMSQLRTIVDNLHTNEETLKQ